MKYNHLSGLVAATFTPFNQSGDLDLDKIKPYAEHLISKNITGIFVCGTSGEGLLLTVEERQKVLEAWMPYQGELKIIAHVSATSYKDSVALAAHANHVKVDAIGCMGPCYLPPKGVSELVAFNQKIAEQAVDIPYYYYHLPGVSNVHIKMNAFLKMAGKVIPNLVGIKFTSFDLMDMQECILMENGRYNILHGHDEILLSGLAAGAKGGVGTSFNLIPDLYHDIMNAFDNRDFEKARRLQLRSIEFVKLMLKYENSVVATKAMFKLAGLDLGQCRLPLRNLSIEENQSLERDLKELDFFNTMKICGNK